MAEPQSEHLRQLRFLLSAGNVRAALELLNLESHLRFTALYRAGESHAQNFMLVDRDDRAAPLTADIPREETYCSLVEAMAAAFVVEDASHDPRLVAHPSRDVVRAYCGVPLAGDGDAVFGTLCQFDFEAATIDDSTLALMHEVASALGPAAVAAAHRADLESRVDRLSDMRAVIATTSDDAADALAMFDSFAQPLRDEAVGKCAPAIALEIEARISAIRSSLGD